MSEEQDMGDGLISAINAEALNMVRSRSALLNDLVQAAGALVVATDGMEDLREKRLAVLSVMERAADALTQNMSGGPHDQ